MGVLLLEFGDESVRYAEFMTLLSMLQGTVNIN